jgi:SAM-dependent methyltransferase
VILASPFKPAPGDSRMRQGGDLAAARQSYLDRRSQNLRFLLSRRYGWCNGFIDEHSDGLELAAGMGIGREFLRCRSLLLTDIDRGAWLDLAGVDASNLPFVPAAFDFVLIQNGIHHLARPMRFLDEVARVLKPGGRLLVRDVKCSFTLRLVAHLTKVEGYDYGVDVFDPDAVVCEPRDPWDANNAVPDLLFDDIAAFERRVASFRVVHQSFDEVLVFLNSGGVTHKTGSIPLPGWGLGLLARIDGVLARRFPGTLALQRSVVLERC